MNDIVIKVENLSKVYKLYDNPVERLKESIHPLRKKYHKDFYALNNINIEIKRGETVGIIGKNGSGKSTLLKILTGVLSPSSGNVSVNGKVSALLELGAGFNPDFTGIENIYLNGTIMGYSKEEIDEKLESILSFADIGDFINQPVKIYSSGMFARLAFAVAINVDPDILIIDETLAVGDTVFQAKCFKKFEEIRNSNKTILFVSHSIEDIIRNCSRGIVLDSGNKMFEGHAKECAEIYKTIMFNSFVPSVKLEQKSEIFSNMLETNKDYFEFGNGKASIFEICVTDKMKKPTLHIYSSDSYTFYFKVRFHSDADNPVFGFVIRDKYGLEITGTNTVYEKHYVGSFKRGDEIKVSFTQSIPLQAGQYFLSFNCTGIGETGAAISYHRLHDIFVLSVVSDHNMLGLFNPDSKVDMELLTP